MRRVTALWPTALVFLVLAFAAFYWTVELAGQGACTHYVDPDWGGTESGTAAEPWQDVMNGWSAINTALGSGDVYICFSAREAGSDVNETWTSNVDLERTDSGANILTLDGGIAYNTDDGTPSWLAYSGAARFQINSPSPLSTANDISPWTRRYRITLRNFVTVGRTRGMEIGNCEECIIEFNDISQDVALSTNGPMFHLDSYATSNSGVTWSDNVIIRNNTMYNPYGEVVYLNGHKEQPSEGVAAGNNIQLLNNTIFTGVCISGQCDGIDVKDGLTNSVIRGNIVYGNPDQGMVIDSGMLIERNYVYDNVGDCIDVATIEANFVNRTDQVIRNNVCINNNRGIVVRGGGGGGDDEWINLGIYNNTIVDSFRDCISIDPTGNSDPTVRIRNNLCYNNDGLAAQRQIFVQTATQLLEHTTNLIYHDSSGNLVTVEGTSYDETTVVSGWEATAVVADPVTVGTDSTNIAHWALQASSPAIGAAATLSGFSDDFDGTTRSVPWDMGAFEFAASADNSQLGRFLFRIR